MKRKNNPTFRAYERLLRNDRDYDSGFMLILERKKLQRMAKYFSEADISYTDVIKAKETSLCVRLLDIVLADDEVSKKWATDIISRQNDIPKFPIFVNLRNALRFMPSAEFSTKYDVSGEERKLRMEHFKKEVRKAKAWHLYNLIREYKMLCWWS